MKLEQIRIFISKISLENPSLIKNCFFKMLISYGNKILALTPEITQDL